MLADIAEARLRPRFGDLQGKPLGKGYVLNIWGGFVTGVCLRAYRQRRFADPPLGAGVPPQRRRQTRYGS
jgi:hypothetical protein